MQEHAPLCMNCKHFDFSDQTANACSAFPAGIPLVILRNERDHRHPVNGDHGIQFKPVDASIPIPRELAAK